MPTEIEDKLVRFIEAVWNRGDLDAIDEFLADRYTIHHDPGDPWEKQTLTVEGFKDRVQTSRAPVPDQKFEIQTLFSDGEKVSITWLWRGTHLGEIAGFAATGREIVMSGATVYFFEDGQITGHWQIADRMSVFQQLASFSAENGGD